MKNAIDAVLITGYDEYFITVIDPQSGRNIKYSIEKANKLFESADNPFLEA